MHLVLRNMTALFSTTLFLSASLLFWVQPMIAKMLLPLLGGVPAVWNTCLVFFQAVLLGGYAYAGDPYFLYSASNLGSLLALLAYPVLLEPHLQLPQQSRLWAIGYAAM